MKKLKERWGITSNFKLFIIILVFSVTGMCASKLARPVTGFLGISRENTWLYWPFRILLIFPLYQILLVFFGWIFGQFDFFWRFEKKTLKRLRILKK